MAGIADLQEIVCELMKTDRQTLGPSTALSGLLGSSLGRARLDAMVRSRLGLASPGVYTVQTFGELCGVLGINGPEGSAAPAVTARATAVTACPPSNGLAVGVDIQAVADLPEEADFWEGEFYRQHFTRQEIAYALLQPEPRETFAAGWCAKEALRKADAQWTGVDWKLTEITHDAAGKPALHSDGKAIGCAVSVSHTNGFAVAVVAMAGGVVPAQAPAALTPTRTPAVVDTPRSGFPLMVSIAALLVSIVTAAYVVLR